MRSLSVSSAFFAIALAASSVSAQITSGSLVGLVVDAAGKPIANAAVTVTFAPTGLALSTRSREDGRYAVSNLRPGGPYTVRILSIGYAPSTTGDLRVLLGQQTTGRYVLQKAAVQLAAVKVAVDRLAPASLKTGTATQIGQTQIAQVPALSRSLQDITRLSPTANGASYGGSNFRYNNLTIDGAASNDAFGFSQSSGQSTASVPTGTPGGLARSQPISLDAIEAVSLAIAPYDVKIGNFTGASINAVTRSGTNQFSGSAYSYGRNPSLVGNGLSGAIPTDFREFQYGGRIGGPIIQDKLFFFMNAEVSRRTDPVLFAPGSNGALLTAPVAAQVRDSLASYAVRAGYPGFNTGTISKYSIPANSEKYFARFDANLGRTVLTLRDNYVNAQAGNLERAHALNKLGSQDFMHFSQNNSLVAEAKTQVNDNLSNNLIFGFSVVNDHRTSYGSQLSPQIEIQDIGYGQINAGSDRESAVYKQRTRTLELTDNATWTSGIHTLTLGTHNELYNVQYTFLNSYNGRWQYPNLAAFLAGQPNRIRATYSPTNNTLGSVSGTPGADFNVFTPSVYLQDEIAPASNFKVTFGVRVDATTTEQAGQSAAFSNFVAADGSTPFRQYTNDYAKTIFVSPRGGFTWEVKPEVTVRGGAGLFQGRMPFAWFAYPYLNNGEQFANVDYRPAYGTTLTSVPLIVDPTKQQTINTLYNQGNVYEINLINNKYVQPQMARTNLAIDFRLPSQTTLTLEGTYTKTVKDILYTNQDIPESPGNLGGADQRAIYGSSRLAASTGSSNPFSAVYVLGNTNKGYRYNITADLRKQFGNALNLGGSYTYGQSKDVANGQRNSPQSNVEYNQLVTANTYPLTFSNFDLRHRIMGTASFNHSWSMRTATSATLIYTGQSGSPYSYVYSGDLNGDGSSNNDLIYIPRDASEIKLIPSSRPAGLSDTRTAADIWNQLNQFITADPYLDGHRGQNAERNGPRTPWNHRVDLRVTQDIKIDGGTTAHSMQLTFDVINVGNLLKNSWGKYYFVPNLNNQNVYPIAYRSGRAVGGTPSFSFDPIGIPYQTDDFQSRWQMQAGLRLLF